MRAPGIFLAACWLAVCLATLCGCDCDWDFDMDFDHGPGCDDDDTPPAEGELDDDTDDDDDDNDDDDDDDTADDDSVDDDVTTDDTAWEDMRWAEMEMAAANFSNALVYFRSARDKLEDDDPDNDGPVAAEDIERCRYGEALMLLTLPLAIAAAFLDDLLPAEEIEEAMLDALGVDDPGDLPTDLITVYLLEIILPQLDRAIAGIDAAQAATWSYALPQIKIMLFGHAVKIPAETVEDEGEHDNGEAALLGAAYHAARGVLRMLAANDIDTGAPNIDTWLNLLSSGDLTVLLDLCDQFPDFLTVHDPSAGPGIDGPALLAGAKADFAAALAALTDDNDGDGHYWLDDNDTPLNPSDDFVDPAETGDDLLDALRGESDEQTDDILRYENGRFAVNVEVDGQSLADGGAGWLLDLLEILALDSLVTDLNRSLAGTYPPEDNDEDGYDNDAALGVSTELTATTLTDATAAWTPGALVGAVLNPNVEQAAQYDLLLLYPIVDNTATTVTVAGDLTETAQAGDTYSSGDGVADDRPADLSLLLRLLCGNYLPNDAQVGVYLAAMFDNSPGLRYQLPLWDEDLGSPIFYTFVVDETESYIDNNANGKWDPGIDTLVDAAHAFGPLSFAADGAYQPYYFFFPEATFADTLRYAGGLAGTEPTDALNRIVSGLLVLLGKGVRP